MNYEDTFTAQLQPLQLFLSLIFFGQSWPNFGPNLALAKCCAI